MLHLKLFHKDILTVRSHQWKYFVEPYSGCAFQCTYCLHWESDAYIRHLHPPEDLLPGFEKDLESLTRKQIIYIGATIDPYQLLERRLRVTRTILTRLIERELPVVILTKSPLILRDLDLLTELHRRQLLMVQFTVLTTNERKARLLERAAPSVQERLSAAARLADCGIPVHFHVSPVIPALYEGNELQETVKAIADHGGQCIYSNILGMRYRNTGVFLKSMEALRAGLSETVRSTYAEHGDRNKKVYSPDAELIQQAMSRLRDACVRSRVDFICEFLPDLDVFEPSRFEQGMFQHGLPAVYQMVQLFHGSERKDWRTFRREITERFRAVDDEYLSLVESFWNDGQLFENTRIHPDSLNGERVYHQSDHLNENADALMSWD